MRKQDPSSGETAPRRNKRAFFLLAILFFLLYLLELLLLANGYLENGLPAWKGIGAFGILGAFFMSRWLIGRKRKERRHP